MADGQGRDEKGVRRIRLRLSEKRMDDAEFLRAFDERTAALGEIDHEFVRRCLINGFLLEQRIRNDALSVDVFSNTGQHTDTDRTPPVSAAPSEPRADSTPATGSAVQALGRLMTSHKRS